MQTPTVTRETWKERAKAIGLSYKAISISTTTSLRSVTAYAQGTRRPSDEWVAAVARLIAGIDQGRQQ
jgi:hypothetical protein